jgi:hypothetical protein
MNDEESPSAIKSGRLVILGLVAIIILFGLVLTAMAIGGSILGEEGEEEPVNVLARSDNECVECHRRTTPGIVEQYGLSTMAAAEVACEDCHEVASDHAGAVEHEATYVLAQPSTAMCEGCHTTEVAQYSKSRHALPAYVAYAGVDGLSEELQQQYLSIPEIGQDSEKLRMRNALHAIEGEAITRFACEDCHNIGKPHGDGSVGQCQDCHLRHKFSLEQARKPETCNHCHIGPDHPQWEIYQESGHGIAYMTDGHRWNWEAEPGTLTVEDFPAPTCATCHFSGFGATGTTHDVGDRLTWFLFAPISTRRPGWQDNQVRMQALCQECHNQTFIETFYTDADALTEAINDRVRESDEIVAPVLQQISEVPFDEPIDFVYFEAWHHWGRTAKFGAWMQGPDYTQWHGIYELLADLSELEEMVKNYEQDSTAATEGGE